MRMTLKPPLKSETQELSNRAFFVTLVAITALGVVLRVQGLSRHELWFDEQSLWLKSLGFSDPSLDGIIPLQVVYWTMWFLGDTSNFALRISGAIAGGLSVFFIGLLGLFFPRRELGLIASIFVATSPFLIAWSQMARPYPFLMLGTSMAITAYAFLRHEMNQQADTQRIGLASICFLLTLAFAACSHHNAVLTNSALIGLLALAIWRVRKVLSQRAIFLSSVTVLFSFLASLGPPLIDFIFQPRANLSVLEPFSASRPWYYLLLQLFRAFSIVPFSDPSIGLGSWQVEVITIGVVGILSLTGILSSRQLMPAFAFRALLLVIILGLFCVLVFLGQKAGWTWQRYVSHLVMLWYLILAAGCLTADRIFRKGSVFVVASIALSYLLLGTDLWRPSHLQQREAKRIISQLDLQELAFRGIILVKASRVVAEFGRWYSGSLPVYALGKLHASEPMSEIREVWETNRRVSRGGLAAVLQMESVASKLPAGRYLIDPPFQRERCEGLLRGRLQGAFIASRWGICVVEESRS